jgi:serine/threonine protein kinase
MMIEQKSFVNNLVQITHENRGHCLVVELTFKSVKDQESYYSMETKARDSLKSLHLNTNLFNIEQHNGCKITYTCEENISFLSESPNPIGYNYVLNLITELVNMSEILSANGFISLGFHPQNIALNHEGNRIFFVSAVDFIFQAGKTSYYFGNFHFAPPESTGRTDLLIDSRSTIYQLGALTYFSLTLKNQYEQSDFEKLIYAILSSTPKLDLSQFPQ